MQITNDGFSSLAHLPMAQRARIRFPVVGECGIRMSSTLFPRTNDPLLPCDEALVQLNFYPFIIRRPNVSEDSAYWRVNSHNTNVEALSAVQWYGWGDFSVTTAAATVKFMYRDSVLETYLVDILSTPIVSFDVSSFDKILITLSINGSATKTDDTYWYDLTPSCDANIVYKSDAQYNGASLIMPRPIGYFWGGVDAAGYPTSTSYPLELPGIGFDLWRNIDANDDFIQDYSWANTSVDTSVAGTRSMAPLGAGGGYNGLAYGRRKRELSAFGGSLEAVIADLRNCLGLCLDYYSPNYTHVSGFYKSWNCFVQPYAMTYGSASDRWLFPGVFTNTGMDNWIYVSRFGLIPNPRSLAHGGYDDSTTPGFKIPKLLISDPQQSILIHPLEDQHIPDQY